MNAPLCTIEDVFEIEERGLIITPDFSVPPDGWDACDQRVIVRRPDGSECDVNAHFDMSHFRITDPSVPLDRRWRIVMAIQELIKSQIPKGSVILAPTDFVHRLTPKNSA